MQAPDLFRQQLLAAVPRLRRYARSLTFDAGTADDLVQTALERALSPPFVRNGTYGTRCSTVVLVEHGRLLFLERRFGPDAEVTGQTVQLLALPEGIA